MKKFLIWLVGTTLIIVAWGGGNYVGTMNGWFLAPIAKTNDQQAFFQAIKKEIADGFKGNTSMVLIEGGEIVGRYNLSKGKPISNDSIFGVSSLGKWVAAVGVMTLVESGKMDLDVPVSTYLTRWQLPPSEFDNNGVTLRRLLSHTAGITDGLGHDGFPPGTPVQPLVEHLTHAKDAEPDKSGRVLVGIEPGSQWQYSGGSYNLTQLIIEEVTGKPFAEYMQTAVFKPLGMTNTAYHVDRMSPHTAEYFGENETLQVYPNYTSLAATGLYSTTNDLAKFVKSQIPDSVLEKPDILNNPGARIISDATITEMRQPIANVKGLDIWGAGPMLFAQNGMNDFIIGHGGRSPMLNSSARLNPATGNGFVMVQTGNKNAFASQMAGKWSLWETGYPDMFMLRHLLPNMVSRVLTGSITIFLISIIMAGIWFFSHRRRG